MNLDVIYQGDARKMEQISDEAVQLVVTSPPYNAKKDYDSYDDALPFGEYLEFLRAVWRECYRVLAPGGRIAINVANIGRQPYIPLNAYVTMQLLELGFLLRGEVIWNKRGSAGESTAWGSFGRASNPIVRDVHEYIILASKDFYARAMQDGHMPGDVFLRVTKSVWEMTATSSKEHPAVFPLELPRNLIWMLSERDDIVLDPFMGTGTTAVAAAQLGRHFVGYEQSARYVKLARRRVGEFYADELG